MTNIEIIRGVGYVMAIVQIQNNIYGQRFNQQVHWMKSCKH